MNLLIIGAGSFAAEVEEMARLLSYDNIAFLDDKYNGSKETAKCNPVIGNISALSSFKGRYQNAIVAMGNNENRMKFTKELLKFGYNIPILVHPTAFVSPDAELEAGCMVRTHAVISRYVHLGKACIVNVGALIDHDCVIGDGSHILMGAVVRNEVTVKPMTWINSNEVIE